MNDRELLELAAKAVNMKINISEAKGQENYLWIIDIKSGKDWNPFTDDGDAFRLAVKLGMEVYIDTHPDGCSCSEAQSHTYKTPENAMRSIVNHDDDSYAATRRAIVRAAAEIGKSL